MSPSGREHPRDVLYLELEAERLRQESKWGEQNHPDGTGSPGWDVLANVTREQLEAGQVTWANILSEEFYEALAESDEAKLREELIQVASVAMAWVEAIDRRPS